MGPFFFLFFFERHIFISCPKQTKTLESVVDSVDGSNFKRAFKKMKGFHGVTRGSYGRAKARFLEIPRTRGYGVFFPKIQDPILKD